MKFKKSAIVASVLAFGLVCGAVGAGAATGIQQIKAALNYNLNFKIDGESWTPKDSNGNKMAPIVYKGSTYLPARAVSEALGATIGLSGNTISIDTGVDGHPYNDGDGSSSSSGSSSSGSSSSSSSSSNSSGVIKLSGSTSSMEEKMREEALVLIHLYGYALEDRDPERVLNYIDKRVSKALDGGPLSNGKEYYKDKFEEYFEGVLEANDDETVDAYADGLKAATLDEVETSYVGTKSEFSQGFSYSFRPEGFDAFSSVYIYYTFYADKYDSDNFILGEARVS
ncbi:hypothetical protein [Paenibacillus sp. NEAU-GSW1]|uniref:hypothetical protein n=1 Tax=Paenibacillus sp. NEAU-GSW1 TaxID=2682486 RepID=UPI0012E1FB0F|nr:hypothetical protein [Paenibacillus sp. NEAU-GSW1]MUT65198.1 hypothetical protein [Paenibacillus sp. NEAU-GSW1]